jgi:hypothetical protein
VKLSGTEVAAMTDAMKGPLVRGNAGWKLASAFSGYSSGTINALERKGLVTVVHGPGQRGVATANVEACLEALR